MGSFSHTFFVIFLSTHFLVSGLIFCWLLKQSGRELVPHLALLGLKFNGITWNNKPLASNITWKQILRAHTSGEFREVMQFSERKTLSISEACEFFFRKALDLTILIIASKYPVIYMVNPQKQQWKEMDCNKSSVFILANFLMWSLSV